MGAFEDMIKGEVPGADLRTAGEPPARDPAGIMRIAGGPDEEYKSILRDIDQHGQDYLSALDQIGQKYSGTQGGWMSPEDEVRAGNLSTMLNNLYTMKNHLISVESQRREGRAKVAGDVGLAQERGPLLGRIGKAGERTAIPGGGIDLPSATTPGTKSAKDRIKARTGGHIAGQPMTPTAPQTSGR